MIKAVLALALASAALAQPPNESLTKLLQDDWTAHQAPADGWLDMSLTALIDREQQDRVTLDTLHRMDRGALNTNGRLLYDLFERQLEIRIAQFEVGLHYTPLGPWSMETVVARRLPPRLETLPAHLDNLEFLLRRGMEAGLLPSRNVARGLLAADVDLTIDRDRYPSTEHEPIERANSALRHFQDFVMTEYLPKCPEFAVTADWPRGRDMYAVLVRQQLGLNISPEALHQMGQREVARLRAAMEPVIRQVGFRGTLDEFLRDAYNDPMHTFEDERELLAAYRSAYERVAKQLSKVTSLALLQPVRFERLRDPLRAATYSVGGVVNVDVSALPLRPRFEVLAIMLHEGPPGHHLQVGHPWGSPLTPEDRALRHTPAYAEGWGLYAESLGDDMGLYTDPWEKIGQLGLDLMRAVRLTIDSGVHGLGWTQEEAIDYVVAQTGRPRLLAEAEVTRIADPATQSAYKAGETVFQRLRDQAEAALGESFDLPRFNDTVLNWGVLPMEVLEKRFEECLREMCLRGAQSQ